MKSLHYATQSSTLTGMYNKRWLKTHRNPICEQNEKKKIKKGTHNHLNLKLPIQRSTESNRYSD